MVEAIRTAGWLWLITGIAAIGLTQFTSLGAHSALVPPGLAPALTMPWSGLIPMLGLASGPAVLLMLAGLVVNCAILFTIANILSR